MTLRSLARGSLLYSIGFVLPRIGSFLLLPIYVSVLSAAEYGAVALVVSVSQLVANFLRLGLDGALMRMHFDSAERAQQDRLIATVATLTAFVATGGALAAALLAWAFFEVAFAGLPFMPYGLIAAVLSFTTTFQFLPATVLRAREQPGRFLAFTGGTFLLTAGTTLALLLGARLGVLGALLGQVAGGAFVVAATAILLARAGGPFVDRTVARRAVRFGLPLVPHSLSGWVLNVSDRWLLGLLLPLTAIQARSQIGIYALAYQLAYAVDLLAQSFNSAWVPFYYRYGDTPQARGIHREMTTLVVAGFGTLCALVAIHAELVIAIIARPEFQPAADLVPILAVAFLGHAFYIAVVTVLFHARQTAILPLVTGAAALLNVGANVALIGSLGVVGAAWSTLISFVFMAAATYVVARGRHGAAVDGARVGAVIVVVVGSAAWATTRDPALSVGRVALDLGVSGLVTSVAFVIALGPVQRLRALTRAAATAVRAAPPSGTPLPSAASGSGREV
jgi:O-antigen/teichoic acid export membrane protein